MKRIGKYEKKPEPKAQKKKTANPLLQTYLTSLLCMVLCVTMFLSTTMAWFTDEVGSHGNQIYVGNLSMQLTWNNGANTVNLASEGSAEPIFGNSVVWTPGHMEARELTLTKDGNMDFSYRLDAQILKDGQPIPNEGAEYALAEYFLVYYNKAALPEPLTIGAVLNQESGWTYSGTLAEVLQDKEFCSGIMRKGEQPQSQKISIVIYLKPEIPSTYTNAKLENIYIFMTAYQTAGTVTVPPVNTAVDLAAALQADGIVVLSSDITLPADTTLEIPAGNTVTLNLNGKKLTGSGSTVMDVKGDLTLEGGTIENAGRIASVAEGGKLTVSSGGYMATSGCAFYAGSTASGQEENGGTIVIDGGVIQAQEFCIGVVRGGSLTVNGGTLTSVDNAVIAGNGMSDDPNTAITINGGTFNAGITTSGYIACGIYHPGKGTLTVNGGTFNIEGGVGILLRDGTLTLTDGVTFNHITVENLREGKVGDAATQIPVGDNIVVEQGLSGYGEMVDYTLPAEYPSIRLIFAQTTNP